MYMCEAQNKKDRKQEEKINWFRESGQSVGRNPVMGQS